MTPTESEIKMKVLARRSIVALEEIEVGEILNQKNIGLRRPGNGLPPKIFESVMGRKVVKKIKKFSMLEEEDFE